MKHDFIKRFAARHLTPGDSPGANLLSPARKEPLRVHVRWMIARDMPAVMALERSAFEYAWREEDFVRCLRERNCIGMVAEVEDAELGDTVAGFMVYKFSPAKLHLLNVAVDWIWQRAGVGRALVEYLVGKLHPDRRRLIALEVRERNLRGQQFFRAMGFRATRTLRGFYDESDEDAYVFQFSVAQPFTGLCNC